MPRKRDTHSRRWPGAGVKNTGACEQVQVVEAVRPHSFFDMASTADEHFLYVNLSIHNESRLGSTARTNMYACCIELVCASVCERAHACKIRM